jgi:hypothetical protein
MPTDSAVRTIEVAAPLDETLARFRVRWKLNDQSHNKTFRRSAQAETYPQ